MADINISSEYLMLYATGISFGLNILMGIVAIIMKSERFYDLTGSLTHILIIAMLISVVMATGQSISPRNWILNIFVLVWAARLGYFLFSRVMQTGEDKRFDKAKENAGLFMVFWILQGVWCLANTLPTIASNGYQLKYFIWSDFVGIFLMALGFLLEVVGDHQKNNFRLDSNNKGKFINEGLWAYSRHPNYLGEIILQFGTCTLAMSAIYNNYKYWGLLFYLCPAFIALLIIKVSGLPMLEQGADKRWGGQVDYENYKKNTAELIPFIW